MDYTQQPLEEKNIRAKKMMLWFGMISICMTFGGLTSAYVVSKSRPDWIENFQLPVAFYRSTVVILASSIAFYLAKKSLLKQKQHTTALLITTLVLGIVFVILQFSGFNALIQQGYFFTGAQSTVTTSFLYVITIVHMAHLFAGLIVISVVLVRHSQQKYREKTLGFELAHTFWHFLDFLWLYLFAFLYFFR